MEEKFERTWLRLIALIYVLSVICLAIAACVTGNALARPELGLFEQDPYARSNIADFGLTLGILITVLQRLSFWVLTPCLVLVGYWPKDRKNKEFTCWGP